MFNLGDKVYSKQFGEGLVVDNKQNHLGDEYPLKVQFSSSDATVFFTTLGKLCITDEECTLFKQQPNTEVLKYNPKYPIPNSIRASLNAYPKVVNEVLNYILYQLKNNQLLFDTTDVPQNNEALAIINTINTEVQAYAKAFGRKPNTLIIGKPYADILDKYFSIVTANEPKANGYPDYIMGMALVVITICEPDYIKLTFTNLPNQ